MAIPDDVTLANSLDDLGTLLQRRARYAESAELHQEALRRFGTCQVG